MVLHAPPGVFAGGSTTIAVLVLLVEFAMLRAALLRAQLRLYAAQSLLLSVLAVVAAASRGLPDLYALAVLSFLLKVVAVPIVVSRLLRDTSQTIAGSGALGVASEVLLAIVVAAFGFFATGQLHISSHVLPASALALAVAVVLVSFVLIIARRDLVSQAVAGGVDGELAQPLARGGVDDADVGVLDECRTWAPAWARPTPMWCRRPPPRRRVTQPVRSMRSVRTRSWPSAVRSVEGRLGGAEIGAAGRGCRPGRRCRAGTRRRKS